MQTAMTQEDKLLPVFARTSLSRGNPDEGSVPLPRDWSWVEPAAWTERMLAALQLGVKGGKWFSLMDKVFARANLEAAYQRVAANKGSPGVDHVTVKMFGKQLEANLERLQERLAQGTYVPAGIRRTFIPKAGSKELRPLGIPTVRDRVVQTALRNVLEPIFERDFAETSYGARPGRSCKDALRKVDGWLREGNLWVVDTDLKSYFDTIPHDKLLEKVREKVVDGKVLTLLEAYLRQQILIDGVNSEYPEEGTPQGSPISPLLSNIYLDPLDHHMTIAGFQMVRYVDDFVVLCRSESSAKEALERISKWVEQAGLKLHPTKTKLVDMSQVRQGFDFLGYHFERTRSGKLAKWPRQKSAKKFRESIKQYTRRNNGHSMDAIIAKLNPIVRGFFNYFKQSLRSTFDSFDGWIRMRLRSILRLRLKLRGRARGNDHHRWPNAYFGKLGLFSMTEARVQLQPIPARGKTADRRAGCGRPASPVRREGRPG